MNQEVNNVLCISGMSNLMETHLLLCGVCVCVCANGLVAILQAALAFPFHGITCSDKDFLKLCLSTCVHQICGYKYALGPSSRYPMPQISQTRWVWVSTS